MKNKNEPRAKVERLNGNMPNTGTAVSSTDFTGFMPALTEEGLESMSEAYQELYGIPDPILKTPDKKGGSQYKIPQA